MAFIKNSMPGWPFKENVKDRSKSVVPLIAAGQSVSLYVKHSIVYVNL